MITAVREWATVNAVCYHGIHIDLPQVVLGKSVAQMAKAVVPHIRLPLLSPEELRQVEVENKTDNMIPVRKRVMSSCCRAPFNQ